MISLSMCAVMTVLVFLLCFNLSVHAFLKHRLLQTYPSSIFYINNINLEQGLSIDNSGNSDRCRSRVEASRLSPMVDNMAVSKTIEIHALTMVD